MTEIVTTRENRTAVLQDSAQEFSAEAYDNRRRIITMQTILLPSIVTITISIFLFIGMAISTSGMLQMTSIGVSVVVTALDVLFIIFYMLARRNVNRFIPGFIVAAITGTVILVEVMSHGMNHHELTPFSVAALAAFNIVIVIAGIIADTSILILVTVVTIVYDFYMIFRQISVHSENQLYFTAVLTLIVIQTAIFLMMILMRISNRRLLQELSAAKMVTEQTQRLDEMKNLFITSINHEMRNPIMAMMNYIEILNTKHNEMASEKRASILNQLQLAGNRVSRLIASILAVRSVDAENQDIDLQVVPVLPVVTNCLNLIDPADYKDKRREIFINIEDSTAVMSDQVMLEQILTNIISNAMKYSPAGSPLSIAAQALEPPQTNRTRKKNVAILKTPMLELTVRDWGLGVPISEQPLLFQKFSRLPRDLTSTISGNGLGLYTCKTLAERMGGSIVLTSSGVPGDGSKITILLPLPE